MINTVLSLFLIVFAFFSFFLLAFFLRSFWSNKDHIFKLSSEQQKELASEMFPEIKPVKENDPTVQQMLDLLQFHDEKNDYSK